MPLNCYQLNVLKDFRVKEQVYGIELISMVTGAGFSGLDAYRKQTWVENSIFFSGAILWNPYENKFSTEGGFTKLADVVIVASRDNRTKAQSKDTKIRYDGIKFFISKVIDCEDTSEIVIFASKLE